MLIYKITNMITGKIYIGQTVMPLARRWAQHKSGKRKCPLYSSMKKHGIDNFIIEEIGRTLTTEELDRLEIKFIAQYDCLYPKGYNLATGGNIGTSTLGTEPWNKGLKATEEATHNQSQAHLGQRAWNKGLSPSAETRLKQSEAKLGKHLSPATEFKAGQPSAFKGRKHSPETLVKISANGNKRQIEHIETGEIYPSILSASKATSIAKSHLRRLAIKGVRFRFI